MLWTYVLKLCGTRKSRLVCDGNPQRKGSVTIGHTYANALDVASERLFWAIVTKEGLIAIGADVSNAFAEAPPPKAPLYMYIDEVYKAWWTNHLGREPLPKHCTVVQLNNTIQGHPEAPRLWEKHIDQILRDLGMKPTVHAPCFYSGTIEQQRLLFLHQVDDFTLTAKTTTASTHLLTQINSKMRIPIKILGVIDRFNGIDIHQTKYYVKITCEKYLYKMLKHHQWLDSTHAIMPIPLHSDSKHIAQLETALTPTTQDAKDIL
jgi:hypothetical protein